MLTEGTSPDRAGGPAPLRVRDAMTWPGRELPETASLAHAAALVGAAQGLPVPIVGEAMRLRGLVGVLDIARAVAEQRAPDSPVGEVVVDGDERVGPDETLDAARAAVKQNGGGIAPVVEDGRLVGTVTVTDIDAHELVAAELGPAAREVVTAISPNDIMYAGSRGAYQYAGITGLQCIRAILDQNGAAPAAILDMGCGHGRVLRYMKAAFPDARFTVCDIDQDSVEFCARTFDARPVVSSADPADVKIDEQFDLIWSGSLFTHLAGDRWPGFLELLARCLRPGGLALFSVNGHQPAHVLQAIGLSTEESERLLADFHAHDFGYVEVAGAWGLSLSRPRWVKATIDRSPLELVSYESAGWRPPTPPQDVVVCAPRA